MRRLRALLVCLLMGYILAVPVQVMAAGSTVLGSGSTFSKVAMDQWVADVQRLDLSINFQGNGSTGGRQNYIDRQVDFAVSEIPFESGERAQLAQKGVSYQYLPIVAGGTSLMYNLAGTGGAKITNLRLSGELAARIFTGKISKWNDEAIRAENSGRTDLPDKLITPVIRSDGSGTSAQFSAFLIKMYPQVWSGFGPNEPTSVWPDFPRSVGAARSDGVANFVASNEGSITYVEAAYAEQRRVPVAAIKNASGSYASPNAGNVAKALELAEFNEDRTQRLDRVYTHPDPSAYPISSYSYMITPTAEKDLSTAKGAVLGKFMIYFACTGQKSADRLGYSPLPKVLVQEVFEAVRKVPGAPAPPDINTGCDNPTITGGVAPPAPPVVNPPPPPPSAPRPGSSSSPTPGSSTSSPRPGSTSAATPGSTSGSPSPRPGTSASPGSRSTSSPRPGATTSPRPGSTTAAGTGGGTGTARSSGRSGAAGGTSGSRSTGSGSSSGGSEAAVSGDEGFVDEAPLDDTPLAQRVGDLEQRVGDLESLVYGGEEAGDGPVDAALKDDLLAAASSVQPAGATGSSIAILALALLVLGPFLGSGIRRFAAVPGRRRRP